MFSATYGDPATMRAFAAVLRSRADIVAAAAQQLRARAEATEFEGPAAGRFRQGMDERTRLAENLAIELQELGNYLLRTAAWSEEAVVAINRQPSSPGWTTP